MAIELHPRHMNEQQSFPFVSQRAPKLTKYGAYSKEHLYYPSDVRHLACTRIMTSMGQSPWDDIKILGH